MHHVHVLTSVCIITWEAKILGLELRNLASCNVVINCCNAQQCMVSGVITIPWSQKIYIQLWNSNTLRKVNMDLLLQSSHVDFPCIHNIVVMELSQPTKLISMQMKYTPRSVLDTQHPILWNHFESHKYNYWQDLCTGGKKSNKLNLEGASLTYAN